MVGAFLCAVRNSRGLSQQALAEISGISQPNISAIERDRRRPSADTLNRLVVSCGYQLAAVAGDQVVACPLPRAGWFPDEDLPARLPGDPPAEDPVVTPSTPEALRARIVTDVLDAARP